MKKSVLILALITFFGFTAFSQAETKTVTGEINSPAAFNDQCGVKVDNEFFVLIKDHKDQSGKSFEINEKYKDLIVENKGEYKIASKYAHKKFKITYYVNGKGWKCIKEIEEVK